MKTNDLDPTQPSLFDQEQALARGSDPATSHEAAASVDTSKLAALIIGALEELGAPSTTGEIAIRLGYPRDSISPRMKPLAKSGKVRPNGRKLNPSGRAALLWELVP